MKSFECHIPNILFGEGKLREIGTIAASLGKKALLTIDPYLDKKGLTDEIVNLLKAASVETVVWTDIQPNPDCYGADKAANLANREKCDMVLGIGGGSAIDFGKGVAVVAGNGGECWSYTERKDHEIKRPGEKTLPIIAVPTTAGTGTEATAYAVFNNTKLHEKSTIVSHKVFPKKAIVDPELMYTMPPQLTAHTGIDALTHAIDSFVSVNAQPFSDMIAVEAITLAARYLPEAVANGGKKEARMKMAWASTLAGMAIGHAGTNLPHALGQPVSGIFGAPHGGSIAACLKQVMEFSFMADIAKYARIAEAMEPDLRGMSIRKQAEQSPLLVERLFNDVGITIKYSDYGMTEKDIPKATAIALTGFEADIVSHPRIATEAEIMALYKECL
jgi:alcohol dehydrogenase class IV